MSYNKKLSVIIATLIVTFLLVFNVSMAQDTAETPTPNITFSGEITAVDANLITVNGLLVNITGLGLDSMLQVGQIVTVEGLLNADGTILAIFVVIIEDVDSPPEVTPEATEEPLEDETGGAIIIIEGPVQEINVNVITIYNINIAVDADDPILLTLQIGDVIRIEGEINDDDSGSIIIDNDTDVNVTIVAINITIIDVDVYVNPENGESWQNTGQCANPPPPWAPAVGWRRKCDPNSNVLPPGQAKKRR